MDRSTADRLGRLVRERLDELGLSRRQAALTGGPTEPTLLKIERGQGKRLGTDTLRKLDVALKWEPGSAAVRVDAIPAGGEQVVDFIVQGASTGTARFRAEVNAPHMAKPLVKEDQITIMPPKL